MKKQYFVPQIKVYEGEVESHLMSSSNGEIEVHLDSQNVESAARIDDTSGSSFHSIWDEEW